MNGARAGDTVRTDYIQPSGASYFLTEPVTINFDGSVCFSSFINIAGFQAASLPGNWQARVIYNNALFAAMIAKHGEAKTEEWLKGLKANLAQKPSGGDREQARDVAAGKCDIGIGNTYYWALMLNNPQQKAWADATKVILPTFKDGGTHVNVSGVVLAKHAPHKAEAMKLIEWLVGDKAQHMYADSNFEYPVKAGIEINKTIAGYGKLKPDPMPMDKIAQNKKAAANLVDKVGFDN